MSVPRFCENLEAMVLHLRMAATPATHLVPRLRLLRRPLVHPLELQAGLPLALVRAPEELAPRVGGRARRFAQQRQAVAGTEGIVAVLATVVVVLAAIVVVGRRAPWGGATRATPPTGGGAGSSGPPRAGLPSGPVGGFFSESGTGRGGQTTDEAYVVVLPH